MTKDNNYLEMETIMSETEAKYKKSNALKLGGADNLFPTIPKRMAVDLQSC